MKISIIGWYGMNNVGDEAFRCVFRQFFRGHELEFVTPPAPCNSPDIVILGGGAVASPFYLDNLPDCPRYALGVDLAYESEVDLIAAKDFKGIVVRNVTDYEAVSEKVHCPVWSSPDLAFYLRPSGTDILGRYRQKTHKSKVLGIFATDYVNPAIDRPIAEFAEKAFSFKLQMAQQLDKLAEDGYEIVLVPCATGGYGDDRRINLDIASFMQHPPTIIFDTIGPQSMIDLIADLDAAVCMRFHSHIFSVIAGTPFVSIEYTRKVKLFLEENNLTQATFGTWKNNEFDASRLSETLAAVSNSPMKCHLQSTASMNFDMLQDLRRRVRREWLQQSP